MQRSRLLVFAPFVAAICAQAQVVTYKSYGLDLGPFVGNQDPNRIPPPQVEESQLRQRMEVIAPYTVWIRTYSTRNGLQRAGNIAHSLGLKAAIGIWIGADTAANTAEIASGVAMANAGEADMLIVGSEVLLRRDLSAVDAVNAELLRSYILAVRAQVPSNIPVTTADVYGKLLEHQPIIDACTVVMANIFPFWESVPIGSAMAFVHQKYQALVNAAGFTSPGVRKPVLISEAGWPSGGIAEGNAVPGPENAANYFLSFVSWARANSVNYFYFEAFDEPWKANYEGGLRGASWGLWTTGGTLKPGMGAVFAGTTVADNWTGTAFVGGTGAPSIDFIYKPVIGDSRRLSGQVLHVQPANYRVAVYIKVGTGWWTKPTFANPITSIAPDGTFLAEIATGQNDLAAIAIRAYLIPAGFTPPQMSGQAVFPAQLDQPGIIYREVPRGPRSIRGQVRDETPNPLQGVAIALTGSVQGSAETAQTGDYSFAALENLPAQGSIM